MITLKDRLDAVCRSLDALHYLNTLLDIATLHDGGALRDPRSGLAELMGRQLEDIADEIEAIRAATKDVPAIPEGFFTCRTTIPALKMTLPPVRQRPHRRNSARP